MDKKTNLQSLFIAIAPNHISNFENIIRVNKNVNSPVLLNPGNFNYNDKIWKEVINGDLDLKYRESNSFKKIIYQIKKILGYKFFLKKFYKHISLHCKYDFYYCNLDDILSNHIFNFLQNKKLTSNNYAVEDGILNYYYPIIENSKLTSKRIFCKNILGINFTPIDIHPTAIHSKDVKAQYVRLPENSICPEKSINLPFKQIEYKPIENVVLIIGQDIMHNSPEGPDYYKERVKVLFGLILKDLDLGAKVVYKPHRNGDYTIAEGILKSTFKNFEMFQDVTPIEECISKIKPKKIYSFESSAMLNLKIAFNEVDIYIAVLPYNNTESKLVSIFKNIGIEILQ